MSEHFGLPFAVSMNSATSGLYAAVGALGIGYGDEVIVSPYTMTASAVAPLMFGAIPVFCDVLRDTGCLDPESIRQRVTSRTRAIIVVHQFGIPAPMTAINAIARARGLAVIEDCAQAAGAQVDGGLVGTFSDISVFSFNTNKVVHCGEGGCCLTRDQEIATRLRLIRNHGEAVVGAAGYENIVNIVGQNYRMTEVHAAIALLELKRLRHAVGRRQELAAQLAEALEGMHGITPLRPSAGCAPAWYVFPMRLTAQQPSREVFVNKVQAFGVALTEGYVEPLYLQPLYQRRLAFKHGYPWAAPENRDTNADYSRGSCPVAELLHFKEMVICRLVRAPHRTRHMNVIACAIERALRDTASAE